MALNASEDHSVSTLLAAVADATLAANSSCMSLAPEMLDRFHTTHPFDHANLRYLRGAVDEGGGYPHWLACLVRSSHARCIVELGSRFGVSTLAIAAAIDDTQQFTAVDIVEDLRYLPTLLRTRDNFRFVAADGLNTPLIYSQTNIGLVDILFTDTVHTSEQVRAEFRAWEPLLADEALFIIDDINVNDKRRFFEEVSAYEKIDLTDVCHSSGFGVLYLRRPPNAPALPLRERLSISATRSLDYYSQRNIAALIPDVLETNMWVEHSYTPGGRVRNFMKRVSRFTRLAAKAFVPTRDH